MPRTFLGALTGLRWSARALAAAMPGRRRRLACCELGNKLEAYETFRRAAHRAETAPAAPIARATQSAPVDPATRVEPTAPAAGHAPPLAALVEPALSLGLGRMLWTLEGLGYGFADRRAGSPAGAEPRDWLAAATAGLPAASLIPLHCGIGLSLARRRLAAGALATAAELRRLLAGYLSLCRESAGPDHAPCLIEALGFIARLRLAWRAAEVAGELARLDADAHAYFWHGVGRALYFLPGSLAPWSSARRRVAARLERETPAGAARDNALAGLAWAITLVNLRHPRVLEDFLRRHALRLGAAPAFARGVASAILLAHHCAPADPWLAAWRRHRPQPPGGELAMLWQLHAGGPAEAALADADRRPGPAARLGELFRVQPAAPASGADVAVIAVEV